MYGDEGQDYMQGDGGNDTMSGDLGADNLFGLAGLDTLYGGDGGEYMDGGVDSDAVYGGGSADVVYGGDGVDNLYGGLGSDYIGGGAGADNFNLTQDILAGDIDFLVDVTAGTDFILLPSWAQNDLVLGFDAINFQTLGSIGTYTFGVAGLTVAQTNVAILFV